MKRFTSKNVLWLMPLLFCGAIAPAIAAVESPASAPSSPTLQLAQYQNDFLQDGDVGTRVETLQLALHRHGLYELSNIDGYYGPLTVNAVKKYQANRGLAVTGVADFDTLYALGISDVVVNRAMLVHPIYGELSTDVLSPNDEGFDVRVLQRVLRDEFRHDDTVTLNGLYDDATRQAIRVFQRARNIQVTGIADRYTLLEMGFQDVFVNRESPAAIGGPGSPVSFYTVIIAGRNQLSAVQQIYSDAFMISTPRGEVISIGAFNSLRSAQQQATQAESRGYRAEVIDSAAR
ncbi:MAG: peptidoglycan-binding protein [Cyanobacteria bacterium J06632_22]